MTDRTNLEAALAQFAAARDDGHVLAVLTGAGLSFGAVPLAPSAIELLRAQLDRKGNADRIKDIDSRADGAFSEAMNLAFPGPDAAKDRREFIDGLVTQAAPQPAHHRLAKLMAVKVISLALTTNFDSLLDIAVYLRSDRPTFVHIYGDTLPSRRHLEDDGKARPHHIVKLHGDPLFTDLGNTTKELDARTGPEMREAVLTLLEATSLAIIGYGCGDPNVMRLLHEAAVRPACLRGGLFFFGFQPEDASDRVIELAATMRKHGKLARVVAPSAVDDKYPAELVLSLLAEHVGVDHDEHPIFGVNERHVGLVERIPYLRTTSVVHRAVSVSDAAAQQVDEVLIQRFVAPNYTLYLEPDTLRRKMTIGRILEMSRDPLLISTRLAQTYGPAELHTVHQTFTSNRIGLQRRSVDLRPLKDAVGKGGTIVLDDARIADFAIGARYETLHEMLIEVAMDTGSRLLIALSGDTRHQPRAAINLHDEMHPYVHDRTTEGAAAINQRWAGFLHSLPPDRRDLAHALALLRGAYRDDVWLELVDGETSLLEAFTIAGLMAKSGPFRLIMLDDAPAGELPATAVRYVADRLVRIAEQRSPVDPRTAFDAHDLYFRLSAWLPAWEVLKAANVWNAGRGSHLRQLFRGWCTPTAEGVSPVRGLPPRQAAEFMNAHELVFGVEATNKMLGSPGFPLWDQVDHDYLTLLMLSRWEGDQQDFAKAVGRLTFLPESEDSLMLRAEVLERSYMHAVVEGRVPDPEVVHRLIEFGRDAEIEARKLDDAGERDKAARYDTLAAMSLDNAANALRFSGDFQASLELTGRVEALIARLGGYSRERGGFQANGILSALLAGEDLGVAEARFVLSAQQFLHSSLPNDIANTIYRLGYPPHPPIERQFLDDERRYIHAHGPNGFAIPGYRPSPRPRLTTP